LHEWESNWHPKFEFPNAIEVHTEENEKNGHGQSQWIIEKNQGNDEERSPLKYGVEMRMLLDATWSETLELESFPFDCQGFICFSSSCEFGFAFCVFKITDLTMTIRSAVPQHKFMFALPFRSVFCLFFCVFVVTLEA